MLPLVWKQEVMSVNAARVGRIPYDELGNGAGEMDQNSGRETGKVYPHSHFLIVSPVGSGCRQVHLVQFPLTARANSLVVCGWAATQNTPQTQDTFMGSQLHPFLNSFELFFRCLCAGRHEREARLHQLLLNPIYPVTLQQHKLTDIFPGWWPDN